MTSFYDMLIDIFVGGAQGGLKKNTCASNFFSPCPLRTPELQGLSISHVNCFISRGDTEDRLDLV